MTIFDTRRIEAIQEAFALARSTFPRHLTHREEDLLAKAVVKRAEAADFVGERIATLALKDVLGFSAPRSRNTHSGGEK